MKFSIRTKLLGTFFILTLFFLAVSIGGYLNAETLQRVASQNTALFNEFKTVSDLDSRVRERLPMLILYADNRDMRQPDMFRESRHKFDENLRILEASRLLAPEEIKLLDGLKAQERVTGRESEALFGLPTGSGSAATIEKEIETRNKKMIGYLDSFRNFDKREILAGLRQIKLAHQSERRLAIVVFGMVFLSLGLAVFFTRSVTAPISKFLQEVKYISHGNLDSRLSIKTGDEIEDLAEAFNQMVSSLFEEEQTAARLQKRLLPPKKIRVKGIKLHAQQIQAKVVGGDWYDYYQTNNSISFLIADASGKGMAGALLATLAMSSIRSEVKTPETIDAVLRKTNKTIENRLGSGNFVTLFYGHLSLETHELSYINCGHEQPILYQAETESWSLLQCRNTLPLGISTEHFHPRKEKIRLKKGDKLLLYTDGLHDARDADRRFFNLDIILSRLNQFPHYPIDHAIDELLQGALDFCRRQIPDDITLLGVEIIANPDPLKRVKTDVDRLPVKS